MMKHLLMLGLFLGPFVQFLLACGQAFPEHTNNKIGAITNGDTDQEHPAVGEFLVDIDDRTESCTATFVGNKTLVTAAHCVHEGSTHRFLLEGKEYQVEETIQHPDWNPDPVNNPFFKNDIAVLILKENPLVEPSILNNQPIIESGMKIDLVGFGSTCEGATDSGEKRITTNTILLVENCRFSYKGEKNICNGDSGGPTFVTIDNNEVQIGIHSAGSSSCVENGWDTRVDCFVPWINEIREPNETGGCTVAIGHSYEGTWLLVLFALLIPRNPFHKRKQNSVRPGRNLRRFLKHN
ncbi:MAG: trypsin-like serine protease [Pseudomonadota bacterium]